MSISTSRSITTNEANATATSSSSSRNYYYVVDGWLDVLVLLIAHRASQLLRGVKGRL